MKILITGGAGSVGKFLTEEFIKFHEVALFDKDDFQLWEAQRLFPKARTILGDVRNTQDIRYAVKWADLIIHAAAYKNIEVTELNPAATADNDFSGTTCIVHEVMKHTGKKFILVSTDKAVYPISALGASKLLAEKLVLRHAIDHHLPFGVARFVNVEESRGNVFDLWRRQSIAGEPLSITDLAMERHFNTAQRVISFFTTIIRSEDLMGMVFIPDVPKVKVLDRMFEIYGRNVEYNVTGVRLNEKLYDPMYTKEESGYALTDGDIITIDYMDMVGK